MRLINLALIAALLLSLCACGGSGGPATAIAAVESFMSVSKLLTDPANADAEAGSSEAQKLAEAREQFPTLFIDDNAELFFSNFYMQFKPTSYTIAAVAELGGAAKVTVSLRHIETQQVGMATYQRDVEHNIDFVVKRGSGGWQLVSLEGWPPRPES